MIKIEKLDKKDIPSLLELYKQLVDCETSCEKAVETYDKMCNNENYLLVVAKDDEKVIGTALGVVCDDIALDSRAFMVIESVVVDENYRGKGIGKMIFSRLDEFARQHNCFDSIIVSSGHRKNAHAFYESRGYTDDVKGFRKNYN